MKRLFNGWRTSLDGRSAMAGMLLGLFLLTLSMAQFEALHHALHDDAGAPEHQCAVTLLQQGQVESSDRIATATVPLGLHVSPTARLSHPLSSSIDELPPGRAPPVFSI